MVGVEGIAQWIGREVVDRDGEKAGKLEDVYYDTTNGEPAYARVKGGTLGRSRTVAPLAGSTLSRDYVRLDATKDVIKDGPVEEAGGRLTGLDATAVAEHYGLAADPDLAHEERVCFQTEGAAEETRRKRAEVEAEQERAAAAASSDPGATGEVSAGVSSTGAGSADAGPAGAGSADAASAGAGSAGAAAASVERAQARPEATRDAEPTSGSVHAESRWAGEDDREELGAPADSRPDVHPDEDRLPPAPPDDDVMARLAELERRVSALERGAG